MIMAERNRHRREKARALGICQSCNIDEAESGKSKCAGCRRVAKLSRMPQFGKPGRLPRFGPQDVAVMLAQRAEGHSGPAIAKAHGCSASTVNRLLKGEIGLRLG